MNINHKFPLILLTGVAIGLAAGTAINAQLNNHDGSWSSGPRE